MEGPAVWPAFPRFRVRIGSDNGYSCEADGTSEVHEGEACSCGSGKATS